MKKIVVFLLFVFFCFPLLSVEAAETTIKKITIPKEQAETIEKIQIHWVRGTVTVTVSEDDNVYMVQKAIERPKNESDVVGYTLKNGVLLVQDNNPLPEFSMVEEEMQQLFTGYGVTSYDLTIALPKKDYREFYFSTKQGNCMVTEGSFQDVIGETTLGTLQFSNITSQSIQGTTLAGTILITADTKAETYALQSVNGTIDVAVSALPQNFSAAILNGHMTVTLPENDGFFIEKANFHTHKGFSTSFSLKDANGKKTYKKGGHPLDISCKNGTVTLLRLATEENTATFQ